MTLKILTNVLTLNNNVTKKVKLMFCQICIDKKDFGSFKNPVIYQISEKQLEKQLKFIPDQYT